MAKTVNDTGITPLGARVLVRKEDRKTRVGNIYLPDTAQQKIRRGVVLEVGGGEMPAGWSGLPRQKEIPKKGGGPPSFVTEDEPSLVGRTVIFNEYAGYAVPDSEDLLLINAEDIQAVVGAGE